MNYPLRRISVRVPWRGTGRDGRVCAAPGLNGSCLKLKRIAKRRDDAADKTVAGKRLDEIRQAHWPACAAERMSFMAPFEVVRMADHRYNRGPETSHGHFKPTPLRHPPYSAAVVPFAWLLREAMETLGEQHELDVHTPLRLPAGLLYAQGVKANVMFFNKKPASETPWTNKLWIYDLSTNKYLTLKANPLKREDLNEFIECYNAKSRHERKPTWSEEDPEGRWCSYDHDALVQRDKASLNISWLRDESLADSETLPPPSVISRETIDDIKAALAQFRLIEADLSERASDT